MDQFDKIIKDKIKDISYDYQPKAWRSFKHSSGMPAISVGAKFAIGGAAIALAGGGLFVALHENNSPAGPEIDNSPAVYTQTAENKEFNKDTLLLANEIPSEEKQEIVESIASSSPLTSSKPSHSSAAQANASSQQNNVTTTADGTTAKPNTPSNTKPTPTTKPIYYGRPLEILVDTISSIDFPDYEVKPADMLP